MDHQIIPHWPPTRDELRTFAKSMVMGFTFLAVLFGWFVTHSWTVAGWLLGVGYGTALLAVIAPPVAAPIYMVWHTVTGAIGWVNTRIILALLYYLVFTSAGMILRILGKDPLDRELDAQQASYWVDAKYTDKKERYERQF